RTKAAATVLRDFSRGGHQVLLFTCHGHISKLFKPLRADVRMLPDRSAPRPIEEEAATAKQPAKPEVDTTAMAEPIETPPVKLKKQPDVPQPSAPPPKPEPVIRDQPLELEATQPSLTPEAVTPLPPLVAPAIDDEANVMSQAEPVAKPARRERKTSPKRVQRHIERSVQQVHWNAEEFDGELADRVARSRVVDAANGSSQNGHGTPVDDEDDLSVIEPTRD